MHWLLSYSLTCGLLLSFGRTGRSGGANRSLLGWRAIDRARRAGRLRLKHANLSLESDDPVFQVPDLALQSRIIVGCCIAPFLLGEDRNADQQRTNCKMLLHSETPSKNSRDAVSDLEK